MGPLTPSPSLSPDEFQGVVFGGRGGYWGRSSRQSFPEDQGRSPGSPLLVRLPLGRVPRFRWRILGRT